MLMKNKIRLALAGILIMQAGFTFASKQPVTYALPEPTTPYSLSYQATQVNFETPTGSKEIAKLLIELPSQPPMGKTIVVTPSLTEMRLHQRNVVTNQDHRIHTQTDDNETLYVEYINGQRVLNATMSLQNITYFHYYGGPTRTSNPADYNSRLRKYDSRLRKNARRLMDDREKCFQQKLSATVQAPPTPRMKGELIFSKDATLYAAAGNGLLEKVIEHLRTTDANQEDEFGDLPVVVAAQAGHHDVVKSLIYAGANTTKRQQSDNKSALDVNPDVVIDVVINPILSLMYILSLLPRFRTNSGYFAL